MVCTQVKAYLTYIVVQNLISVAFLDRGLNIFGPIIFLGVLYLLCKYHRFTVANVLVALTVVLGVLVDLSALTRLNAVKQMAKKPHRLGPGGTQQPHRLGPGGTQQQHLLGPGGTYQY